mmetsp:Transcript_77616/g.169952  ORF Transcript_77616/g.169952 Transcript_77616/m.169952 type:complete len:139 (+) Transcript_77616:66-482(+)
MSEGKAAEGSPASQAKTSQQESPKDSQFLEKALASQMERSGFLQQEGPSTSPGSVRPTPERRSSLQQQATPTQSATSQDESVDLEAAIASQMLRDPTVGPFLSPPRSMPKVPMFAAAEEEEDRTNAEDFEAALEGLMG